MLIGQLVYVDSNSGWSVAVVEYVYDKFIIVSSKKGERWRLGPNAHALAIPTVGGLPVISAKNIFGKWTYKPRRNIKWSDALYVKQES